MPFIQRIHSWVRGREFVEFPTDLLRLSIGSASEIDQETDPKFLPTPVVRVENLACRGTWSPQLRPFQRLHLQFHTLGKGQRQKKSKK